MHSLGYTSFVLSHSMPRVTRKQSVAKKGKGRGTRRTASRVRSGARSKRCTRPLKRYPRKRAGTRCTIKGGSQSSDEGDGPTVTLTGINDTDTVDSLKKQSAEQKGTCSDDQASAVKTVTIQGEYDKLSGVYKHNQKEKDLVNRARKICLQHINEYLTQAGTESVHQDTTRTLAKFFEKDDTREIWFGDNGFRLERINTPTSIIGEVLDTRLPIDPKNVHTKVLQAGAYILSNNNRYCVPEGKGTSLQLGTPILEADLQDLQDVNELQVGHLCAVRNGRNPILNGYTYGATVPVVLQDQTYGILHTVDGITVKIGDWVAVIINTEVKYGKIYDETRVRISNTCVKTMKTCGVYPLLPSDTFSYALVLSKNANEITLSIDQKRPKTPFNSYIMKIRNDEQVCQDIKTTSSCSAPYLVQNTSWLCSWLPTLIKESELELDPTVLYSCEETHLDPGDSLTNSMMPVRTLIEYSGTVSIE